MRVYIIMCIFPHIHFFFNGRTLPSLLIEGQITKRQQIFSNFCEFFLQEPPPPQQKKQQRSFPIPYEFASYSPVLWPVRCCFIQWSDICTCCLRRSCLFSLTHYSFMCTMYNLHVHVVHCSKQCLQNRHLRQNVDLHKLWTFNNERFI